MIEPETAFAKTFAEIAHHNNGGYRYNNYGENYSRPKKYKNNYNYINHTSNESDQTSDYKTEVTSDDSSNNNNHQPKYKYNQYNNNLSVITEPDNLGSACNFQPFSFNLGSGKSYYGLPNNPDFELSSWNGSPCDTITKIREITEPPNFNIWFYPETQILFLNASKLKGKSCIVNIYDISGRLIKNYEGKPYEGYFTLDIQFQVISNGIYIVELSSEKEKVSSKFINY